MILSLKLKEQKMTFLELAQEVLQKAEIPLKASEIWERGEKMGLVAKIGSQSKTPKDDLASIIYVNVKHNKDSAFLKIGNRPARFWLKARESEVEDIGEIEAKIEKEEQQEIKNKEKDFLEKDLHPLLVNFLYYNQRFNLHCKTINANTSKNKNKGLNEWIHPDIVGIHFPFDDFKQETLNLLANLSTSSYKIYSFELKRFINNANLKECYFQAMSNSSWANEGYLVAYEIKDDEVRDELARLNASFGIGVLELKSEEVIFEAKSKDLDIATLDMLVEKNKDFKEFIDNVNKDIQTNDADRIAKNKYDEILEVEAYKALKEDIGQKYEMSK